MSSQFELDDSLVAGSGHWFMGVAGGTLFDRDVVYIDANGTFQAADADGAATMPAMGITLSAASAGDNVQILVRGFIENTRGVWTAGAELYVSTAPGAITHTAPSGVGDLIQQVGIGYTTTLIYFDPVGEYNGALSLLDYEVQTGIIAEPATASKGNGHVVVVHNETEERDFLWIRTDLNTKWMGCEYL